MDFFPSAKVRLRVRLEEFGTEALKDKAPAKTTPRVKGVKDDRAPLQVVPDPESSETGRRRFILSVGTSPATTGGGSDQTKSDDGLTHEISGVIPAKASWKQNGIRTADTLTLSIRWEDMPIDPRVIRACAVQFYLGTVTQQEFAEGIAGRTRADQFGSGTPNAKEPLNVVRDTYSDAQGRQRTNLRFEGWVDKWKLTSGDGEAMLDLECVDNTRLLEKQVRPPKLKLGMEKPIDEAIAEYLSHFPQMSGLVVEYLPSDTAPADIPKLKGILSAASFTPKQGPPASGGGATGGASETVLDYLTSVVGSIAHSMRFDGTTLVIQRASNLFGSGPVPRAEDPYQGRNLPSGRYPVRTFIYGRNVMEYVVERDFTRKAPKNIEVRSYDSERKNVAVARYPEKSDHLVDAGPGDGKADKAWTVVQIPDGIRDLVTLKAVAQEIYSTVGRQEILVHVKTKNLATFGGDNEDPDLLDMTLGDAFEIKLNKGLDEGSASARENQLAVSTVSKEMLVSLGFAADFADAYSQAYTDKGFQQQFKMKEMSVDWDINEGVSFEVTGMNYVVARVDRVIETESGKRRSPAKKPPIPHPPGQPPKGTPTGNGGVAP